MNMTLQSLLQSGLKASDEMALACENRTYSFRQFDHITDVIAFNLTERFGRNNEAVIVCMKQTDRMVMAIMGIIRAGMTYVIVSTNYPDNRKNFIKEESKAVLSITDDNFGELIAEDHYTPRS